MSEILKDLTAVLNGGETVLNEISPPITEVYNGLLTVEHDVGSVISFVNGVNDLLKFAATIGEICSSLVEIPIVGEILEIVGDALTEFTTTVNEFLKPIENATLPIVKKVKTVLHDINKFLGDIAKKLNYFMVRLPKWANVVQIIYFGWQVCDILVGLLSNTAPAKRLESLLQKFSGIGKAVKTVYDAVSGGFTVVVNVLKTILKPFWDGIKSFFSFFEPIATVANKVFGVFHTINHWVDVVEDAIKPIKWALDALKCIFDTIVKPILDWILDALGIKKLFNDLVARFLHVLHLDGLQAKLGTALKGNVDGAHGKVQSSHGNVLKISQMEDILKEFIADPQQALMTGLFDAITGTSVKDGAFPPPIPTPKIDFGGGPTLPLVTVIRVRPPVPGNLAPVLSLPRLADVSKPVAVKSPTDFSDLDVFISDIKKIVASFQPVLTLGTNLQDYVKRTKDQLVIPSQLHGNLPPLQTEAQFLYDASSFLQMFPIFKVILPTLTGGLKAELTSINNLDTNMTQLVTSTTALSTSLQPILDAENPNLFDTITKMTTSLNNWSMEAQRYKNQILHAYKLDQNFKGKFKPRIDALAKTFHTRLGELQTKLTQIKDQATTASTNSHSFITNLSLVTADFDKIDPYVERLEQDIAKVSYMSKWAGKIDGIFSPLKSLLKNYTCQGDKSNIKGSSLEPFKLLIQLNNNKTVQQDFQRVFQALLDQFFPVQTVGGLVSTGNSHVKQAANTIATGSKAYIAALNALISMRAGKYQFTHQNKKTKKTETIDNHFFNQKDTQEALQLGKDMGGKTIR